MPADVKDSRFRDSPTRGHAAKAALAAGRHLGGATPPDAVFGK